MERDIYLAKADESLAGAESEYANGRYNNTANRCYYASFQAAVSALAAAGIAPRGADGTWSHSTLQAQFAEQLIRRRKVYPGDFSSVLLRNQALRETADYEPHWVTEVQATRVLRRTRGFVDAIHRQGGGDHEE
ncbi:MAG: HEPN domain-containing protein [Chloroflexi bacterium]|nr:HEPN domain-containing protein [Chloroflexota bacterium]